MSHAMPCAPPCDSDFVDCYIDLISSLLSRGNKTTLRAACDTRLERLPLRPQHYYSSRERVRDAKASQGSLTLLR